MTGDVMKWSYCYHHKEGGAKKRGREERKGNDEAKLNEMRSTHFFDVCICKPFRYLQNRKTINELPEPMKKLQRKAWREATRRHRAKKMAQAALSATSMSQTQTV